MELNQYSMYSMVSTTEQKNVSEIEEILKKVSKLGEIKKVDEVKKYLLDTWNINNIQEEVPISKGCNLTFRENDKHFSVKVSLDKEVRIYSYNK